MSEDYIIVGHVSRDLNDGETAFGGTATYAARAARLLGWKVKVLTSAPEDLSAHPDFEGCEVHTVPSDEWTSFENHYEQDGRRQIWHSNAAKLDIDDVPRGWQTAAIMHIGPIAQEVPPDLALGCPAGLCCATIQGWLRGRSYSSNVLVEVHADLLRALRYLDAAVVSQEDVQGDRVLIRQLADAARILVVTRGPAGCQILMNGESLDLSVEPVEPRDPTGAGDVFAAAFFSALSTTGDALGSGRFANKFARWFLEDRSRLNLPVGAPDIPRPETDSPVDSGE